MATIPMARIRAGAVSSAVLVTLLVTAGLGNQALSSWRASRAGSDGLSGWTGVLFQPLQLTGWRFAPQTGAHSTEHWLAPAVFNVVLVLATALLVGLATRGTGRLGSLLTTWGMVTFAGAIAAAASTPFIVAGLSGPASRAFATTVPQGLSLGLVVGAIAGVVACVFTASGRSPAASAAEPVPGEAEATAVLPLAANWPLGTLGTDE